MNIVLVSDGKYGDRAVETIRKKFQDVQMQLIEHRDMSEIIDEYEFEHAVRSALQGADLIISYIRHPDINIELAMIGKPLVIGIDHGLGFLKQVQRENARAVMPSAMCHLLPDTGISVVDEFARAFGLPVYAVELDSSGSKFKTVTAHVESPCGATARSMPMLSGKEITPKVINDYAINIAQECRESVAYMMSKSDDTDRATMNHVLPLLDELERINPSLFGSKGVLGQYAREIREKAEKGR